MNLTFEFNGRKFTDKTDYSKWKGTPFESFLPGEFPFENYGILIPPGRTRLQQCEDALEFARIRIHDRIDAWLDHEKTIDLYHDTGILVFSSKGMQMRREPKFHVGNNITP